MPLVAGRECIPAEFPTGTRIEACGKRSSHLKVGLACIDDEHLHFFVDDNGVGVSTGDLEQIFASQESLEGCSDVH